MGFGSVGAVVWVEGEDWIQIVCIWNIVGLNLVLRGLALGQ